ncbi:amidohydrolase family protein [Curtobacterium herbarum]|uniref:amidohydrolase family protein n=1 Tax=Curtobacterium herbarum TaxID=150122 RepID=UPI001C8DF9F7|nr:amidohydrolase family protein [Curtobacterium herbarum]MBY0175115.1 amidohydrolase family protein [Curtobacterium herbarum]
MSVLFTDVLLWAPEEPSGMTGPTDLLVTGTTIAVVGPTARAAAPADVRVVDGRGHHIVLPGLVNAHFHSPANHLKGAFPSRPLETFMLYESPSDPALTPTPREAYLRTMLGALEMLRTGTTSVQDDAFLMPTPDPEVIDAVMQAYADSGIRASVALDQPELPDVEKLPFLDDIGLDGLGADEATTRALHAPAPASAAELLDAYDHLFRTWHGAADGRLTAAVSISAPQRVSPEYFGALDDLSRTHDVPLFAHMLETRTQRALSHPSSGQPRFAGRSLVRYTADLGLLSDRVNVIHAVWVDDDDLDLIAAADAVVAHNPVSNLRLGSGVMPFRAMRDRGIRVALGVDEAICDDTVNTWGVVKQAGLIHTVTGDDPDRWPRPAEVLEALWDGGAAAMRRDGRTALGTVGRIAVGAEADLALLDLRAPAFTPFNDLRGQLVYCESGTSVRMTVVAGTVVAEGGRVTSVDEDALLAEARELHAARRPALERTWADADRLRPAYAAVVRRAAATDLGLPDRGIAPAHRTTTNGMTA